MAELLMKILLGKNQNLINKPDSEHFNQTSQPQHKIVITIKSVTLILSSLLIYSKDVQKAHCKSTEDKLVDCVQCPCRWLAKSHSGENEEDIKEIHTRVLKHSYINSSIFCLLALFERMLL